MQKTGLSFKTRDNQIDKQIVFSNLLEEGWTGETWLGFDMSLCLEHLHKSDLFSIFEEDVELKRKRNENTFAGFLPYFSVRNHKKFSQYEHGTIIL